MSQPATVPGSMASPGQPVVVTLLTIAVIALTALVLQWLTVPSEVTASLSPAAGALVPAVAVRRREGRKGKADRVMELVSGTFRRPPAYVLIIAAGVLGLIEYFTYFLSYLVSYAPLIDAEIAGLLTAEESTTILLSPSSTSTAIATLLGFVATFIVAVPVGSYVARRIGTHPLCWAVGAVVLNQSVSFLIFSITTDPSITTLDYSAFLIWTVLLSVAVWIGVRHGSRTRALFLATRLFRRLSEADRTAVLALMQEAQVAKRLSP